ncbi:MAG: DUF1080 domain-containing protein [Planctomycetota bacterium]|nr:DUF1080 domain-containing protein [Planctomycetota bacterium]
MWIAVLPFLAAGLGGSSLRGQAPEETVRTSVPPGFAFERASVREGSFLALCFDGQGRAIVGAEGGPILRLSDEDGDGLFERDEVFQAELFDCQGLAWRADLTFAVARRGDRAGVWRIEREGAPELLVPLTSHTEHGAHGLAFAPDGALVLACGNESSIDTPPTGGMTLEHALDGDLLPTLPDPLGVGSSTRIPYGFVARIDPASGAWGYHSIGFRNHYDLAFDREGDLFTVDSDMEYDEGLPWYRPVRALHARFGIDYGFRRGSAVWSVDRPDRGGAMAEAGRGSPTGVAFGHASQFPERWREALYCGDWSRGRILAFELEPRGASYTARVEEFADGPGCASVTDLCVGPDGALYLLRGGRGLAGPMQRIAWRGSEAVASTPRPPVKILPASAEHVGEPQASWFEQRDGSPAAERALRRVCEDLAQQPALLARFAGQLAGLLTDDDLALAQAVRAALARLEPDARHSLGREMAESSSASIAAQGFLLLATATEAPFARPDIERALDLARAQPAAAGTLLVALAVAAQRGAFPPAELRAVLDAHAPDGLRAPGDERAQRAADELEAHAGGAPAISRFLARAETAARPVDAIRAAQLATSATGWGKESLARFLAWYETTRAWTGGANFRGYLEQMRDRASADATSTAELLCDDSVCEALPPAALAFALRRVASIEPARRAELRVRTDDIAPRFTLLSERQAGLVAGDARRAVIAEITGSRDEPVLDWLVERLRASEEERGLALIALARAGRVQDVPRFVSGLDSPEFGVPKACADALMALPEPPEDVAIWARVLDRARALGYPRGWPALRVLAHWLGLPKPDPDPARFDETWRRIQAAVRARFPAISEASKPAPRPAYEPERLRRFLLESASRPASSAAGARVFARATCSSCHTIGGRALVAELSKGASGPDLGGVSKRLRGGELFDALARPSLAISDQYRTLVVETRDGLRYEGRPHRDDARGIALVESDGRAVEIATEDILARRVSTVSPMPEGLLAPLTYEEVRDLLAFLASDGEAGDETEPWEPLFGPALEPDWAGGALFTLEDGVLVGRASRLAAPAYLVSGKTATDFEVEFDVLLTRGGNSGLQYRSTVEPDGREPVGYQADIGQFYWGSLYASDGRGLLHEADPRTQRATVDFEGWNHYFVRVVGDRHVIEVNGRVLTDVHDARHGAGRFAWQLHEGLEMEVRVANARVRNLR